MQSSRRARSRPGAREHFPIALDNHPFIQIGMQRSNIDAQPIVHRAVDEPTRRLTTYSPFLGTALVGSIRRRPAR